MPMLCNIILADPPWRYSFSKSKSRQIENQYLTMSQEEIIDYACSFPRAINEILYLWATAPKLREALEVMQGWGLEYKTHAVWDKGKIGMGYWFRGQHELLLVGTRGRVSPPIPCRRIPSIFHGVRTKHSQKPLMVHEMIESWYPDASKIELFARARRPGWLCLGNEVPIA